MDTQTRPSVVGGFEGAELIRVYTARTIAMVGHIKNVLEASGIPCFLRNEFLSAGFGELHPPSECWPEVWVTNDSDAERALELLSESTPDREPAEGPWRCPRCGEEVDAIFAECWNCGAER